MEVKIWQKRENAVLELFAEDEEKGHVSSGKEEENKSFFLFKMFKKKCIIELDKEGKIRFVGAFCKKKEFQETIQKIRDALK